jgi:cobalamin synthase
MRTAAPASLPLAVQVAGLRHADGISDTSDGRAAVLEQLVAEMMPAALDVRLW